MIVCFSIYFFITFSMQEILLIVISIIAIVISTIILKLNYQKIMQTTIAILDCLRITIYPSISYAVIYVYGTFIFMLWATIFLSGDLQTVVQLSSPILGFIAAIIGFYFHLKRELGKKLPDIEKARLVTDNTIKYFVLILILISALQMLFGSDVSTKNSSTQSQTQVVNQIWKQILVGTFSGHTYYTTPGNCTNSAIPVCDGKNDTMMKAWSTETVMRNATSTTDGKVNTTLIMALPNVSEYPAIKYCADMTYATYDDWYLPAKDELNILYSNKDVIQGFDLTNIIYWSSTEENYFSPWYQGFKNGIQWVNQFGVVKGETGLIRCIRKE